MKLLELLVQEKFEWPGNVMMVHRDHDGQLWGWDTHGNAVYLKTLTYISDNAREFGVKESMVNMVTREQYEAASQQLVWNGEGLPPVDVDIEYKFPNVNYRNNFSRGKVLAYGNQKVFMEHWSSKNEFIQPLDNIEFRPIRSERDEAINQIAELMGRGTFHADATSVYNAIAAGKIPGVKLSD